MSADPVRKDGSFYPTGKGWSDAKNGPKGGPKDWAKALHFDARGCLFIKDPDLAREIEKQMKTDAVTLGKGKHRGVFWMYREGTAREQEQQALRLGLKDETDPATHPVNMMCPCVEG